MIEEHWKGITAGVQKLEQPDEGGSTYRLCAIDGYMDEHGDVVLGSGTGRVLWLYFDDEVAKTIHEQTSVRSRVVKPAAPKLVVPRGKVR